MQAQAAAAKQPTLEESLKRAGASDEQIASIKKALDIPAPSLADFDDQAAWNRAAEAYADEFGSVIGADEKTVASMKNILSSLPAGEPEESAPRTSADCAAQLVKAGMEPAAAARLVAVLDEDVPDDPKELLNDPHRKGGGLPRGLGARTDREHTEKDGRAGRDERNMARRRAAGSRRARGRAAELVRGYK